ncbi:MAG: PilZ domain-containing protein [Fimbriimonas sp.]
MDSLRVTQGLLDARATFQRLTDARIVRGWIVGVDGALLSVRAAEDLPLNAGEQFAVRTARLNGDVAFLATMVGTAPVCAQEGLRRAATSDRPTMLDFGERSYSFEVMGQVVPMPPSGDPRYVCEPSRVVIGNAEAELRDISPSGLGVTTLTRHYVGEQVTVVAENGDRPVKVLAEVRYCRQLATHPPLYRIGLHVLSADRIERARWLGVVKSRSQTKPGSRLADEPPPVVEPMPLPRPKETGLTWVFTAPDPEPEPLAETPLPEAAPIELWEGWSATL